MPSREQFPYLPLDSATPAPWLPVRLSRDAVGAEALGLVDSGAALSVLPFSLGLRLGLQWNRQTIPLRLAGNLKELDAWAVTATVIVADFPAKVLTFAWTRTDAAPLILG